MVERSEHNLELGACPWALVDHGVVSLHVMTLPEPVPDFAWRRFARKLARHLFQVAVPTLHQFRWRLTCFVRSRNRYSFL
ncbi:MAG: hypothetical protein GXP48_08905 [Acidobacteria bacterium]|nr:hypothetical protein [Acidobacteriota bacterium]